MYSHSDHVIYLTRFDEYPSHGWLLSQQPVDMLTSLKQYHMSSIIKQLKANNGDPKVYNRAVVLIQYLCGLVRCVYVCTCVYVCACTFMCIHICVCICV